MGEPATVQMVRSRGNESRLTFTCGVLTPFGVAVFEESALGFDESVLVFEASVPVPEESAVVAEPAAAALLWAPPLAVSVLASVLVVVLSAEAVFCPDCEQP